MVKIEVDMEFLVQILYLIVSILSYIRHDQSL